jgi:PEP-CTERM motif
VSSKSTTLFIAVIFSAAPVLADRISVDPQNAEAVSHYTQPLIHGNVSALCFVSEDTKIGEVDVLEDSRLSTSNTQIEPFALGSNEGYRFGRDNDNNARRKHRDKGRDGSVPISSVAVPEPGSPLLLLFGLAGLGILFYRRNSPKQAI